MYCVIYQYLYLPLSQAIRTVANLTERKNQHTYIYVTEGSELAQNCCDC